MPARRGFTLIELLIVVTIVVVLTAIAIPAAMQALEDRRVSSGALLLQAELSRARDAAIRANAPHGIRLLPEPLNSPFSFFPTGASGSVFNTRPAYTRMIAIEMGPDYNEGYVRWTNDGNLGPDPRTGTPWADVPPSANFPQGIKHLVIWEAKKDYSVPAGIPNSPTGWYWNIRQGDKLQVAGSGTVYTIVGPMVIGPTTGNPERFINFGAPAAYRSLPNDTNQEFLFLVNGLDDNQDGYIDNTFDGIDNDGDGTIDPGYDAKDNNIPPNGLIDETGELVWNANTGTPAPISEYQTQISGQPPQPPELETAPNMTPFTSPGLKYTIFRRPAPAPTSRELSLPAGIVVDMTTWNAPSGFSERSRLPVDPSTGYIDILIAPTGQAIRADAITRYAPPQDFPYYHFWLCDAEDVYEPIWGFNANTGAPNPNPGASTTPPTAVYLLPLPPMRPQGGWAQGSGEPVLKSGRRLVSLNTRTGQITTSRVENFDPTNPDAPFIQAQTGAREAP